MADGYYVATVHDSASHPGSWDADATLIAAAPDLLAALEGLLFNVHHGNGLEAWHASTDKAEAAILKAKGDDR